MKQTSLEGMRCSAARALNEVGPWWSLLIVRCSMQGLTRFKEYQAALGIAKNTLSMRLKELLDAGILEKKPDRDGSKYHEYFLTAKGFELYPVIFALMNWGDKWIPHELGPSYRVLDNRSQGELRLAFVNDKGEEVPPEFIGGAHGEGVLESLTRGGR